jgi:hypothetical protein
MKEEKKEGRGRAGREGRKEGRKDGKKKDYVLYKVKLKGRDKISI